MVRTTHADQTRHITKLCSWEQSVHAAAIVSQSHPPLPHQPSHGNPPTTPQLFCSHRRPKCAQMFLPSRKCSVMLVLVFTGRYQTRPVGWSRLVADPLSVPGHVPGQADPLQGGSPGQGGGRPDRGPSWAPYPLCPLHIPPNGRNGSLGLGVGVGGGGEGWMERQGKQSGC